jgi:pimeloyl-ACP methyl ester carboxylesterase
MVIHVRGVPVFYEEAGAGRPLLMLHGWPLDHNYMMSDLEPVFETRVGWRRLYPDLPGMGRTPGADWITGHEHMLDLVLDFMDAMAPGEPFVAASTSYGASLARCRKSGSCGFGAGQMACSIPLERCLEADNGPSGNQASDLPYRRFLR